MKFIRALLAILPVLSVATAHSQLRDRDTAADGDMDQRVRALIGNLAVSPEEQIKSIRELRLLGSVAIPYMIKHMNDMREVPTKHMHVVPVDSRMPASPVSVLRVAAVVSHLLAESTRQGFPNYFYGFEIKSDDELVVNRWREWCESRYPALVATCWNELAGKREVARPLP